MSQLPDTPGIIQTNSREQWVIPARWLEPNLDGPRLEHFEVLEPADEPELNFPLPGRVVLGPGERPQENTP